METQRDNKVSKTQIDWKVPNQTTTNHWTEEGESTGQKRESEKTKSKETKIESSVWDHQRMGQDPYV